MGSTILFYNHYLCKKEQEAYILALIGPCWERETLEESGKAIAPLLEGNRVIWIHGLITCVHSVMLNLVKL